MMKSNRDDSPQSLGTPSPGRHSPAEQLAAAQALAAAMPHHEGRASESGRDSAVAAPRGAGMASDSPAASASSLSEPNESARTSELDPARSDASNQVRHGQTIPALGASKALPRQAGVAPTLANGDADPGLVMEAAAKADEAVAEFITALGRHRHPERAAAAMAR